MTRKNKVGIPLLNEPRPAKEYFKAREKKLSKELSWREIKRLVFSKCDGCCYYCGEDLIQETATVDHYVAKFHSGSDELSNLVPCCVRCNDLKGNLTVERWRAKFETIFQESQFYAERER